MDKVKIKVLAEKVFRASKEVNGKKVKFWVEVGKHILVNSGTVKRLKKEFFELVQEKAEPAKPAANPEPDKKPAIT